jgi:type I site-specific restriction-modification system R (restriction) subunit
VITDRNDLDGQLFIFARCRDLLRCDPEQAASRADLREETHNQPLGPSFQ